MQQQQLAQTEHRQVSNVRVPPQWAKLLRRLMALQDGKHQIVLDVETGVVKEWVMLIPHKVEK